MEYLLDNGTCMVESELYLLGHGDIDKQGCYIGSTDLSLSAKGRQQVKDIATSVVRKEIDAIFCSPMFRCRETSDLLGLSCPCYTNDLLKEIDFGRWEGKSFAEITRDDADAVTEWATNPTHFYFPGGESMQHFYGRIELIQKLLEGHDHKRVLLVTHGGIIRHLLCLYLGIPRDKYLVFDVQPGSLSSIALYSEGGVLTGLNQRG